MLLTNNRISKIIRLFILILLIVGIFIYYKLNSGFIHNELVTLNLIPKPEQLTELYFDDSTNLPKSAASNQVISFAFVIHNLEATDYRYTYNVSINANGTRHIVDKGNVLVKNDQYYVKNEKIALLNFSGSQEVIVEITNKQLVIHFRTENNE